MTAIGTGFVTKAVAEGRTIGLVAASDNLSRPLFHGTAHIFKPGDIVEPQNHVAAFASTYPSVAHRCAASRARDKGHLFGMVYEVEPVADDLKLGITNDIRTSRSGFRVKRLVDFTDEHSTGGFY